MTVSCMLGCVKPSNLEIRLSVASRLKPSYQFLFL